MEKRKQEFSQSAAKKVKFEEVDDDEDLERKKNNRKLKELGTESDESDASIESDSDQEEEEQKRDEQDDDMFGESFEKKKKKALNRQDIEGQEWTQDQDEEKFEPFNLEKEMEEGYFDESGYYVRKKDELAIHDTWLQGVTKEDMERARDAQEKINQKNEEQKEIEKDANQLWVEVLTFLKPKETLTMALKRFGGSNEPAWKKKKSNAKKENQTRDVEKINQLTYLSDQLMSLGHFDIYDLNYEQIIDKLKKQGVVSNDWIPGNPTRSSLSGKSKNSNASLFYEFKWGVDANDIFGPYSAEDMKSWQSQGYFDNGSSKAWIREVRSGEFALQEDFKEYNSNLNF